jgi:hypothetical protein
MTSTARGLGTTFLDANPTAPPAQRFKTIIPGGTAYTRARLPAPLRPTHSRLYGESLYGQDTTRQNDPTALVYI